MPELSVIVPFYGVEDYLAECLDSILAQTLTDFECILVDDGSVDGSLAIAQRYAAGDPRLRIVGQENAGLGPARNTGIDHATGEFLMFVDSDDLLAPRAFSLLVGALRESGSDFAVGNAWRFARGRGIWPSWTHLLPCADDRRRTNVREFPELVRDRMAWNKVYRRTFWDAHGYRFPAIRYEDYPVTLAAHLDAEAVDVLSDRVYLWRERETGMSITQQMFDERNAEERALSANLVLDLLDRPGLPPDVVEDVNAYFVGVDLVALAGALVHVGWDNRAHLETIVRRLALRLHPQARGRVPRLSFLVHRGLRQGDFEFVRSLARWRENGDREELVDALRRRPGQVPAVLRATIPPRLPRVKNPLRTLPLEAWLVGGVEEAGRFAFNVEAKLRRQFIWRCTVTAWLVADGRRHAVLAETVRRDTGLKIRIVVTPADVLTSCAAGEAELRIRVVLNGTTLRWLGSVAVPDPGELPAVLDLGDGRWALAARLDDETEWLRLAILTDPVVAEGRKTDDDACTLTLNRPVRLVLTRPAPTPDVTLLPEGDVVTLRASEALAGDLPDDPVTRVAARPFEASEAPDGRLYLSRFPGALRVGDVTVRLVPNERGYAEVRASWPTEYQEPTISRRVSMTRS